MKKLIILTFCLINLYCQGQIKGFNWTGNATNWVLQATNIYSKGNTGILFVNKAKGDTGYIYADSAVKLYFVFGNRFKSSTKKILTVQSGKIDTATLRTLEIDPVYLVSVAYKITSKDTLKWDTGYTYAIDWKKSISRNIDTNDVLKWDTAYSDNVKTKGVKFCDSISFTLNKSYRNYIFSPPHNSSDTLTISGITSGWTGFEFHVKNMDNDSIVIHPTGGVKIDGSISDIIMKTAYGVMMFVVGKANEIFIIKEE